MQWKKKVKIYIYDNLGICRVIICFTIGLRLIFFKFLKSGNLIKNLKEYQSVQNHIKVSKISQNQMFIPVILFWVIKVVKKGVLWEQKFTFSLGLCRRGLKVNFLGDFWGKKRKILSQKKLWLKVNIEKCKVCFFNTFLIFFLVKKILRE